MPYRPPFGDSCGALVLTRGELFWTADPGLGRGLWHRIPNDRLVVECRTHDDTVPADLEPWPGYRCLDADRTVEILCEPDAEPYLRAALSLRDTEPRPPVTDALIDPAFWASRADPPTQ